MNRRQLFVSTAKAALASALGSSWLTGKARAQTTGVASPIISEDVIHGVASPDATVSIGGRQLPPASPVFGGVIRETAKDSTPWCLPRVVPPEGAANVLLIMTDDQGYGVSGTFGGVIPTPTLDRVANAGLRYTQFHSTALCSPTRAALITGRNHHEVGFGVTSELATGFPGIRRDRYPYRSERRGLSGSVPLQRHNRQADFQAWSNAVSRGGSPENPVGARYRERLNEGIYRDQINHDRNRGCNRDCRRRRGGAGSGYAFGLCGRPGDTEVSDLHLRAVEGVAGRTAIGKRENGHKVFAQRPADKDSVHRQDCRTRRQRDVRMRHVSMTAFRPEKGDRS